MTSNLRFWSALAGVVLVSMPPLWSAQPPVRAESVTLKEIISRLDQVDFDLQGLESNVKEFRLDFSHGLGGAAAIRVLDIGVGLVRDRVQLNQLPQVIGAMQRESRTDSWQRGRQQEMMKRHGTLLSKHGSLYRVVEGYAADVKTKFGIDLKGFFDALEVAVNRGDANVEAVVQQFREAVGSGDARRTAQLTQALTTGGDIPPPLASEVVSVVPHPTRPGYFIVRYADGREEIVQGKDNGDGTVTLSLPNGESVTAPLSGGARAGGPGGAGAAGGMAATGGGAGAAGAAGVGTGAAGAGGAGADALGPNVRRGADGGYIVTETLADGTLSERYFPANLQGVGTRYLGDQGARLTEETREVLDTSTGQIRKGQSIRWQFTITPTGQAPDAGGTRATFKLADRAGQGKFTATGWKISQPDGSVLASGTGDQATAVATQSGAYRVEFSGNTEWGSPFRIEVQVQIAVQ